MKRKFNHINNIEIINDFNKNKSNIDNKINELIELYKSKYGNDNYLSIMISIYFEPIIFIKYNEYNIIEDVQPILKYSFIDYYFFDKSYEVQFINYIKYINKKYNYICKANPYFIKFDVTELFQKKLKKKIYELYKIKYNITDNIVKEQKGANFNYSLFKQKYETDYFETYFITDFIHDFYPSQRSFLSKESEDLLNNNVFITKLNEIDYFIKCFNEKILTSYDNNSYIKVNNLDQIKSTLYNLLNIINSTNSYVINEASGLKHFFSNETDKNDAINLINNKIVFSLGAYMDSYNQSENKSPTLIYKNNNTYEALISTALTISPTDDYRNFLGVNRVNCSYDYSNKKYIFNVYITGSKSVSLEKDANNVTYLSIFFEFILSNKNIENIILNKDNKSNTTKLSLISEYNEIYFKNYIKIFVYMLIYLFTTHDTIKNEFEIINFLNKYNINSFIDNYDNYLLRFGFQTPP